jgi:TolB-like protein
MRYARFHLVVLALLGGLSLPTLANAQTPATRPGDARILILPFTPLNPEQSQAWLGRSIQQSLLADLTAAAPGRLLSADTVATDMASAADLGRKAGAAYVVQGSFITLPTAAGEGLRMMGEVIEVDGAKAVTSFKATGLYTEIFRLEDQMASQIRFRMSATGVLPSPVLSVPAPRSSADVEPPLPQVNEYEQAYGMPQTYGDAQSYYNYYYANPYSSAGYGYGVGLGWPFLFSGAYYAHGSNFSGFDHDRFGVRSNRHEGSSHSGGGASHSSGAARSSGGAHGGHR